MTLSYTLTVPGPLLTTNRERAGSRYVRAAVVAEWRRTAKIMTLVAQIPRLEVVRVEFFPVQAKGRLADAGAHLPSAKAVLDGVVDAGVLEDDDPRYVNSITMHSPTRAKKHDELTIVLYPVTP